MLKCSSPIATRSHSFSFSSHYCGNILAALGASQEIAEHRERGVAAVDAVIVSAVSIVVVAA